MIIVYARETFCIYYVQREKRGGNCHAHTRQYTARTRFEGACIIIIIYYCAKKIVIRLYQIGWARGFGGPAEQFKYETGESIVPITAVPKFKPNNQTYPNYSVRYLLLLLCNGCSNSTFSVIQSPPGRHSKYLQVRITSQPTPPPFVAAESSSNPEVPCCPVIIYIHTNCCSTVCYLRSGTSLTG